MLNVDRSNGSGLEALPGPCEGDIHVDDLILSGGARDAVAGRVRSGAGAAVQVCDSEVVRARLESALRSGTSSETAGAAIDGAPRVGVASTVSGDERVDVTARGLREGDRVHTGRSHSDEVGDVLAAVVVGQRHAVRSCANVASEVAGAANASRAAGGVSIRPQGRVCGSASFGRGEVDDGSVGITASVGATVGVGSHGDLDVDGVADQGKLIDGRSLCNVVVEELHAEDVRALVDVDVGDIEGARRGVDGGGRAVRRGTLAHVINIPDHGKAKVCGVASTGVVEVVRVPHGLCEALVSAGGLHNLNVRIQSVVLRITVETIPAKRESSRDVELEHAVDEHLESSTSVD
mmetsp:Transcript_67011/g.93267  ORF Transcript_67011/g.93267 Transcript_67011/m.93267 type:complete len:349 (+) Transcript_67011:203-1249(+)